jgi:nitrogen-specific signal transduction histidine kinase
MNHTTSQQWLWTAPLPEAISGVIHELRMPVASMRGAVDLLHQYTSCQTYQHHYPLLHTQIDRLRKHIDQLFELRAWFQQIGQQDDITQHQIEPSKFVVAISSDLYNDLVGLQRYIQTADTDCYALLENGLLARLLRERTAFR